MTPQTALLMSRYNRWMNQAVYEAARTLPGQEVTRDRGAFFGSILQTLNHIAAADLIWLHRFAQHPAATALRAALAGWPAPTSLRQPMAPSLEALEKQRQALDEVIDQWVHTFSPELLADTLSYRNMAGEVHAKHLGSLVQHFFNHQTHHRGQASTLLFQAGVDVGVTDLLAMIPDAA